MARWETSALPEAEQFEFYEQVICRAFVPLRPIAHVRGGGFASTVETRPLGALNRASVASRRQATHHGPGEVSDTDEAYYFVNLQLEGRCLARQGNTESLIAPGQLTVLDTTRPFYLDFDQDWRMLSFRVPHSFLDGRFAGGRLATAQTIDDRGAGAAAVAFTRTLWSIGDDVPDYAAEDLTRAFAAVVTAALSSAAPDDELLRPSVSRALVVQYLHEHLADPALSVGTVSRALALSPRRLHTLFEGSDETFAAALRTLRMRRAAELLADPARTVTAVGAAVGYPDPASFSRAFRRVHGEPPAAFRRGPHELQAASARIA
ncbi:MAG: helix-turn-helix domain-containing protein [Actinobacteria bacterium]|nr:helix-turn-helix domain-containing protein [Actinomycetota bacterium]